ncbi:unnamed protein product, partial [Ectocarpus sp. 12 AP-2014]
MAWGSGQQTLVASNKLGDNYERPRMTRNMVSHSLSPERQWPPSSSKAVHHRLDPIQAVGVAEGTFIPVPDSVLYEPYSRRPLKAI